MSALLIALTPLELPLIKMKIKQGLHSPKSSKYKRVFFIIEVAIATAVILVILLSAFGL